MAASWERQIVANGGREEVVLLDSDSDEGLDSGYGPHRGIAGYVHAHDGSGRALYDGDGRPILIPWQKQKAFSPSLTAGVWILVVLQLVSIIAGIVGAVALHDLSSGGHY